MTSSINAAVNQTFSVTLSVAMIYLVVNEACVCVFFLGCVFFRFFSFMFVFVFQYFYASIVQNYAT